MASKNLKQPGKEKHNKVKEALRHWDPIGGDCPEDEYDSYAGPLVTMLERGAAKEKMTNYLRKTSEEDMGVSFDAPKTSAILDELVTFWSKFKTQ